MAESRKGSGKTETRFLRTAPGLPGQMWKEPLSFVVENPFVHTYAERLGNCLLSPHEPRVRFDPFTGEIYISSWRHKKSRNDETIHLDQGTIQLGQRGKKPKGTLYLRWNRYPDIQTAVRGVGHIIERYGKDGGDRVEGAKAAIGLVMEALPRFREERITEKELKEMTEKAEEVLAQAGFLDAQTPNRQRLTIQILAAFRKDSTGRVNPLISRTRLSSAWLKLIKELLFAGIAREKYGRILTVLLAEDEAERFSIGSARQAFRDLLTSRNEMSLNQAIAVARAVSRELLTPEVVKVAPYRRTALICSAFLFGVETEAQKKILEKMLEGERDLLKIVSKRKSIERVKDEYYFDWNVPCEELEERLKACVKYLMESLSA